MNHSYLASSSCGCDLTTRWYFLTSVPASTSPCCSWVTLAVTSTVWTSEQKWRPNSLASSTLKRRFRFVIQSPGDEDVASCSNWIEHFKLLSDEVTLDKIEVLYIPWLWWRPTWDSHRCSWECSRRISLWAPAWCCRPWPKRWSWGRGGQSCTAASRCQSCGGV